MKAISEDYGKFNIRSCSKDDIHGLMDYFKKILSSKHILADDLDFINWQYFDSIEENYNFIIGVDKENNSISGVVGFIPNGHYGVSCFKNDFIWLSNWAADKNTGGLGLKLLTAVIKAYKGIGIGGINISPDALKIYSMLKFENGVLNHYFMPNNNLTNFKLLKNYNPANNLKFESKGFKFIPYSGNDNYVVNKYIKSLCYKYHVFDISDGNSICASAVFRISENNGASILRLIDFSGDINVLESMYFEFQNLICKFHAEALEFYCYGIDYTILLKGGFILNDGSYILPYHFEPFADCNVTLNFVVSENKPNYIFKGDGDRERPGYRTL